MFGPNWELVLGSSLIITSPLHVQNKIPRSNKWKQFSGSARDSDRSYVVKVFPGTTLQLAEVLV